MSSREKARSVQFLITKVNPTFKSVFGDSSDLSVSVSKALIFSLNEEAVGFNYNSIALTQPSLTPKTNENPCYTPEKKSLPGLIDSDSVMKECFPNYEIELLHPIHNTNELLPPKDTENSTPYVSTPLEWNKTFHLPPHLETTLTNFITNSTSVCKEQFLYDTLSTLSCYVENEKIINTKRGIIRKLGYELIQLDDPKFTEVKSSSPPSTDPKPKSRNKKSKWIVLPVTEEEIKDMEQSFNVTDTHITIKMDGFGTPHTIPIETWTKMKRLKVF